MQIAKQLVPNVFEVKSLKEKCEVLTTVIYHLLSDLTPSQSPQPKPRYNLCNRQLKGVTEKKTQLKKEFREVK